MQEDFFGIKNFRKSWGLIVETSLLDSSLSMSERALYIALFSYVGKEGDEAYPSVGKIAKRSACSESTVYRTLKMLEEKGIVKRIRRFNEKTGGQRTSLYGLYDIPECYLDEKDIEAETGCQTDIGGSVNLTGGMGSQNDMGIKCASATGGCQIDSGRGCQNDTHNVLEDLLKDVLEDTALCANTQNRIESENQETKAKDEKREPNAAPFVEPIPHRLMPVIDHFLTITGRKTLKPQELKIIEALSGYSEELIHQEISIAVGRFRRMNRPLHSLLLNYIVGSLSKKSKKTLPQGDVNLPDASGDGQQVEQCKELSGWEYADTRKYNKSEVKELYETGGWGNFGELKMLCEVCRLGECEISELYEELSIPVMMSA